MLTQQILRDLLLPLVSVREKLLLIIQQFLVRLGRKLKIRSLHNSIHRTRFLTKSTVNALRHINVIPRSSAGSVLTLLGIDRDSLGWAGGFAKFASDAALIAGRITAQGVFTTETGTQVTLFERVIDGHLRFHGNFS